MSFFRFSRLLPVAERSIVPSRGYRHVVGAPPKRKLSTAALLIHGGIMTAMGLSIPAWVLVHLKDYQGRS